jgi:tRNA pseudouridine38-40 synthase
MSRYFVEVKYKGTLYSGFQKQQNAGSVQEEIEKAFGIFFRNSFQMTCSSRTDTGVHALQNFLHFDYEGSITDENSIYNINAILPPDIVVKKIYLVQNQSHCRFDATCRTYQYYIHRKKDPFLKEIAYFYPFRLDMDILKQSALLIKDHADFTSFSKRRTQVKTFTCNILDSKWKMQGDLFVYSVKANRFLRGMVRGLVGTMLLAGRKKISLSGFEEILNSSQSSKADFSVPGHGLFLAAVEYPESVFQEKVLPVFPKDQLNI